MNNLPAISYVSTITQNKNECPKLSQMQKSHVIDSVKISKITSNPDYIPSKMLLSLLKTGLTGEKVDSNLFKGRTYEDWVRMYNLGHNNAVTPFLLDGLRKSENIKAPDDVLKNMKINEEYVREYHKQQEHVFANIAKLAKTKGIEIVPLKGLGLSLNYDDPQKRFGGDIDVYTFKQGEYSSKSKNNMAHIFDDIFEDLGIKIDKRNPKHSEFECKGIPIENHRTFIDVDNEFIKVPMAKKFNKYLQKVLNPSEKVLPMGTKVLVPSKEFNNVFLTYHAMTHFLHGGINFHHLLDWAAHIKQNGLEIAKEVKDTPVEKFMIAMTNLTNEYLGTNVNVPKDKDLSEAILHKILNPDKNLSDVNILKPNSKNPIKILKYKYDMIKAEELTKIKLLGESAGSVKGALFSSFLRHCAKPSLFIKGLFKVV